MVRKAIYIFDILLISFLFILLPSGIMNSNGFLQEEGISPYFESDLRREYKKFIVITWDGVRSHWLDKYSEDGVLPYSGAVREEGGETYLRIVDHPTGTDPGLTCIETGFGPNVTGIDFNQFGSGSPKLRIPDGMQTSERLKESLGSNFKTGHLNSWVHHLMNDSLYGFPFGSLNQDQMLDSIFLNAIPGIEVDNWFGAENISWDPDDDEAHRASYDEFWHGSYINGSKTEGVLPPLNPDLQTSYGFIERFSSTYSKLLRYWSTPLIHAPYLAEKANEFIDMYKDQDFYLRIHMTEPDHIGHDFYESVPGTNYKTISPEYLLSLIACDNATCMIRQKLINAGIYEDTILLIGTDHGFYGSGHDSGSGEEQVDTTLWLSNQRIWGNDGNGDYDSFGLQNDIQPTVLALAGVDWTAIEYPGSKPVYLRYDTSPPEIQFVSSEIQGQNLTGIVKIQDRAGLKTTTAEFRKTGETEWTSTALTAQSNDLFEFSFTPSENNINYEIQITAQDDSGLNHETSETCNIFCSSESNATGTSSQGTSISVEGLIFAIISISTVFTFRRKRK
jgi:predicted AlkP superfamily pyrophosphatase or phosphodiesterase